ncbi:MAG: DHH family phosphoesterase [Acidobacteriaceae bacterium]
MPLIVDSDKQTVWHLKPADPAAVAALTTHLRCPPAIAHLLASRNITTPAAADAFLNPSIDQLHSPLQLLGIPAAVDRILTALRAAEPILIYGDYDVDGTTATVLLKTTLERIALALDPANPAAVTYHVPHRIREGYGMQSNILAEAAAAGIRLVISVDTGIRAIAEAAEARTLGLDLIVTDHHLPEVASPDSAAGAIPDALAVINPNQPACPYPNKNLCGAAVVFKLAHALLLAAAPLTPDPAAFTTRTNSILIPSFLKLVAIATIADSVPLTGENRVIAALGLAALANPVQPGLRALMRLAKLPLDRAPTATEVGFRLAPRINAAGRMDIASDVVELFLTRDPVRAQALAEKLDSLNTARRDSEARALDAIDRHLATLLDAHGAFPADCLILDHPDWHRGVLGILASRVVDRTGRPALVITHSPEDGSAHGSGRSIPGFHLLNAITAADTPTNPATESGAPCLEPETWDGSPRTQKEDPLFHRFGGHAHAVGFSFPSTRLPDLRARIRAYAAIHLNPTLLTPQLDFDAELSLSDINPELAAWLQRLAPFGIGNPEPIFLTRSAALAAPVRIIQEKHICLQLAGGQLVADRQTHAGAPTLSAVGWSRGPANWPQRSSALALAQDSRIDLLYHLRQRTGSYANPHTGGLELELRDMHSAPDLQSSQQPSAAIATARTE